MSNKEGNNILMQKEETMHQIFPPDIIMEILIRTDIESLPRLRWVCKEWRRLISHPHFMNRHHQKAKNVCGYIVDITCLDKHRASRSYEIFFFPHPSPVPSSSPLPSLTFMSEPVHIKASTPHGLVLCFGLFSKSYYVCKPTTQEWSTIPNPDSTTYNTSKMVMSVSSTSPLRFRIMRISSHLKKHLYQCEVFDSDSCGMWKTIESVAPLFDRKRYEGYSFKDGLVINGSFFWIKHIGEYEVTKIMCVDLWKEEGSTMVLPREVTSNNENLVNRLSNLGGSLGLVSRRTGTVIFDIWAMGGSWLEQKWEKICVLNFDSANRPCRWSTFGWIKSDFIVDNNLLLNPNGGENKFFWYNFKEDKYIDINMWLYLDWTRLYFFQSDYFPCNIDECPYNNPI